MSRGFVKEDDQEEAPFIPPRAPLPDGVTNYVTPRGLELLHAERVALDNELKELLRQEADSGSSKRLAVSELEGRLALLNERIVTARVVEQTGVGNEVRFGSTVTYRHIDGPQAGTERTFTIVGVDEADVKHGYIAFISPLAKALMGKRAGELGELSLHGGKQRISIVVANS